jgi:NAD(P)-dependent dehydrogenase (short-subunit alcohol dehydrogenase family)
MIAQAWSTADIPDQSGRVFVVTGANSGLGLATARALAAKGAHVVCACRDTTKGKTALTGTPGSWEVRSLDLADLSSVAAFAADLSGRVDVLVNNAGVMAVPPRRTVDGFEMQLGTNHLGHFALTGRLLPQVTDRVVTLTSLFHRLGRIRLDDLNWERRRYQRWLAYAQSKLANLMFCYELQRRLTDAGSPVRSLAAHPGYAATNLQSRTETIQDRLMALANPLVGQSPEQGALPELCAATSPELVGGVFLGPSGPGEMRGAPRPVGSSRASHNASVQRGLWAASEELTGVRYEFGAPAR